MKFLSFLLLKIFLISNVFWVMETIWGCSFSYAVQEIPNGLAQAFVIGEKFVDKDKVAFGFRRYIFYGAGFQDLLYGKTNNPEGGVSVCLSCSLILHRYGVVEFDSRL